MRGQSRTKSDTAAGRAQQRNLHGAGDEQGWAVDAGRVAHYNGPAFCCPVAMPTSPWIDRLRAARPGLRVATFDVFDTLLRRDAAPARVVECSARLLASSLSASPERVLAHRLRFAAAAKRRRRGEQEWRLEDWLAELARAFDLDVAEVSAVGRTAEWQAELAGTSPDPEMRAAVIEARAAGIRTCAVSDTWHDERFVRELLGAHDIPVDAVFTSAERRGGKYDGRIFAIVLNELGVRAADVAHVGDHAKSDWLRPQLAGWAARWRPAPHAPPGGSGALGHALRAVPCDASDPLHAVACDLLAPLLVAHTLAMAARSRREGVGAVGYLARDGWLFERAADALAEAGVELPRRETLRLSRRSVTLAHPGRLLERDDGVPGKVGKATIGSRLGAFDLPDDLQAALLSTSGLGREAPATVDNVRRFASACQTHAAAIEAARDRQRELLRRYVHRVMGEHPRIALVDTGWAGTVQDALAATLPSTHVVGWYLGVNGLGLPDLPTSRKEGWCWDVPCGRMPASPWERSAGVIRCWEVLLREPVASVQRLIEVDGVADVERTAGIDITPQARAAAARIAAGVDEGVQRRLPGVLAYLRTGDVDASEAQRLVAACATELTTAPTPAFARAILALEYGEGGTVESTTSLRWRGVGTGTTWVPGALAAQGVGVVSRWAEPLAAVAAEWRLRGRRA